MSKFQKMQWTPMFGVGFLSCILFTVSLLLRQESILSACDHPSYVTTTLKQTRFDQGINKRQNMYKLEIFLQIRLLPSATGEDFSKRTPRAISETERKSASVSQMKSVKAQLIAAITLSGLDQDTMP